MVYFDEVLEVRFSLFLQIRFFLKHSEFGINNSLFRSSKFDREVQAKINIRRINTIFSHNTSNKGNANDLLIYMLYFLNCIYYLCCMLWQGGVLPSLAGMWSPISQRPRSVSAIEEGFIQKRRQRSSLLFGGQNLFNSLPR